MSLGASEFLFFGSAKEASNDVNTFQNLRFIKKQNQLFFSKKHYMLTSFNKVSLIIPDFLQKIVLSRTSEKVHGISKILSSKDILKKQKIPGFYMHADISRLQLIYESKTSLQEVTNLYILKQIINRQWSNSQFIYTFQLNSPLSFQMLLTPWKSLSPAWVLLLVQESYLLYINLYYKNLGYKIYTTILKNHVQTTLVALIGENQ